MTENTINNCKEWLDSLILDDIPKHKGWQRSLMDITGIKHHENMWSDIYKFFFKINEEHGLKDLFIRSLEQVLHIDNEFLVEFTVRREYVVDGNERIDLFLYDKFKKNAIIIENKVYHSLNNNLDNYYESIKKQGFSEILVLVLGLKNYRNTSLKSGGKYYSITHLDLLETVLANLPKYSPCANPYYLFLLQEFYKNIKNHTNMIDKEVAAFFIKEENRQKIFKIHDIYRHVKDYLMLVMECKDKSPIKDHINRLNLIPKSEKTDRGEEYVKYIFKKNNQMMLTVFFKNSILRPNVGELPHIHIVLEIQSDIKKKVEASLEKYIALLYAFKSEGVFRNEKKGKEWWHFSSMFIPVDDLSKLPEIISETIDENCPLLRLGYAILYEIQND